MNTNEQLTEQLETGDIAIFPELKQALDICSALLVGKNKRTVFEYVNAAECTTNDGKTYAIYRCYTDNGKTCLFAIAE